MLVWGINRKDVVMVCSEMICFYEFFMFMKVATPDEKEHLSFLFNMKDREGAVVFVGEVIGVTLTLDMVR